jgi:hypothetical protein
MKGRPTSATNHSAARGGTVKPPVPPLSSSAAFARVPQSARLAETQRGGSTSAARKNVELNYAETLRRMQELLEAVDAGMMSSAESGTAAAMARDAVDDMIAQRQRDREEETGVLLRCEMQEFAEKTKSLFKTVGAADIQAEIVRQQSIATPPAPPLLPIPLGAVASPSAVSSPLQKSDRKVASGSALPSDTLALSARLSGSMTGNPNTREKLDLFEVDDVRARRVSCKKSPFVTAVEVLSELSFSAKGIAEDVLVAVENAEEVLHKLVAAGSRSSHGPPAVDHREIVDTQRSMVTATEKISELYGQLTRFRKGLLKLESDVDERDRALGPTESLGRIVKEELVAVKQERDRARRDLATHKAAVKFRALLSRTRERASYYERTGVGITIEPLSPGTEPNTPAQGTPVHPKTVDPMRARAAASVALSAALSPQAPQAARNALRTYSVPTSKAPNSSTAADREEEEQQLTHCIANVDVIVATVVHVCIDQCELLWQRNPVVMLEATRLFCHVVERVAGLLADRGRLVYRSNGNIPHSNFGGYHLLLFKSAADAVIFASTLHYALTLMPWPEELLQISPPVSADAKTQSRKASDRKDMKQETVNDDPKSAVGDDVMLERIMDEFDAKLLAADSAALDGSFSYEAAIDVAQKVCASFVMPASRVTNLVGKKLLFRGLRAKVGVHSGVVFIEGSLKNAAPGAMTVAKNDYAFRPANSRGSNPADTANPLTQEKSATDDVFGTFNARVPLLYGTATMKASILCGLAHGGETLVSQSSYNSSRGALEQLMMHVLPVAYLNKTVPPAGGPLAPAVPIVGSVLYSLFESQEVLFQVLPGRLHRRALFFDEDRRDGADERPSYNPIWWLPFCPFAPERTQVMDSMQRCDSLSVPCDVSPGQLVPEGLPVAVENVALRSKLALTVRNLLAETQRAEGLRRRASLGMRWREAEEKAMMQAFDQSAVEYVYGCVLTRVRMHLLGSHGYTSPKSPTDVITVLIAEADAAPPSSYAAQLRVPSFAGVTSQTAWFSARLEETLVAAANGGRGGLQSTLLNASFGSEGAAEHWTSSAIGRAIIDIAAAAMSRWEQEKETAPLSMAENFNASNRLAGSAVQSSLVQFAVDLSSCAIGFVRARASSTDRLQQTIYEWNRYVCAVQNSDGTVGGTPAEHILVSDEDWGKRHETGGGKRRRFVSSVITAGSELLKFAFEEHVSRLTGATPLFEPSNVIPASSATEDQSSLIGRLTPRAVDDRDFKASWRVATTAVLGDYRPVAISRSTEAARCAALMPPTLFLAWQHTQSSMPFAVLYMNLSESQFPYATLLTARAGASMDIEVIRGAVRESIERLCLIGAEARQLSCYFLPCFGSTEQMTVSSFAKHESSVAIMYPPLEAQVSAGDVFASLVSMEGMLSLLRAKELRRVNCAMMECWFLCVADAVNALHQCNGTCGFISPRSIFVNVSRSGTAARLAAGPAAFLLEGAPLLLWRSFFGITSTGDASPLTSDEELIRVVELMPPELLTELSKLDASMGPDQCASSFFARWVSVHVSGDDASASSDDSSTLLSQESMEAADVWMLGMTMWLVATGGVSPFASLRLGQKIRNHAVGVHEGLKSHFAAFDHSQIARNLLELLPSLDRSELVQKEGEDASLKNVASDSSAPSKHNLFGSRGNLMRQLRLAMSSSESGGCAVFNPDELWCSSTLAAPKGLLPRQQPPQTLVKLVETTSLILLCDLLHWMLQPDPASRFTMAQVLSHPYFSHVPSRAVDRMATEKVFPQYVGLSAKLCRPNGEEGTEKDLPEESTVLGSLPSNLAGFLPVGIEHPQGLAEEFVLDTASISSAVPVQAGQSFSAQVDSSGSLFQVFSTDFLPQLTAAQRSLEQIASSGDGSSSAGAIALRSVLKDGIWTRRIEAARNVISIDTLSATVSITSKSLRGELSPFMVDLLQLV